MSGIDRVEVNSSRSSLRRPLKVMRETIHDLPSTIGLSLELSWRELRSNFQQSKLGFLWMVLQPAIYGVIFVVIKVGMRGAGFEVDTGAAPPGLFALTGITLYQAWLDALNKQLRATTTLRSMLKTVRMPPEILFFTPFFTAFYHFLARLIVIIAAVFLLGWDLDWNAAWFPIMALGVIFTGQAIGFFLMPVATLYRDISEFISSISIGILLLSPILYPATTNTDSVLHTINCFNPLGATLSTARDFLLRGDMILLQPALIWFAVCGVITLMMMLCTRVVLPILLERLL